MSAILRIARDRLRAASPATLTSATASLSHPGRSRRFSPTTTSGSSGAVSREVKRRKKKTVMADSAAHGNGEAGTRSAGVRNAGTPPVMRDVADSGSPLCRSYDV